MEINTKNLCSNVVRKIALLMTHASTIGMDISGYGQADENKSSGNVYLWLEDYPFTLFIDLSGDDIIQACWSNPENGDEVMINADGTLQDLYDFVGECESDSKVE